MEKELRKIGYHAKLELKLDMKETPNVATIEMSR